MSESDLPPTDRPNPVRNTVALVAGLVILTFIVLYPNFARCRDEGRLTACRSNLKNLGTALEMYSTDYAGLYPRSLRQLTPNYLKTIPVCPAAGTECYRVSFGPKAPYNPDGYQDFYYLECMGANHTEVGVEGDYPVYNGLQGFHERVP